MVIKYRIVERHKPDVDVYRFQPQYKSWFWPVWENIGQSISCIEKYSREKCKNSALYVITRHKEEIQKEIEMKKLMKPKYYNVG